MGQDFLQTLGHLGFTARIKRLNESIVSSTLSHYANISMNIEPNWHVIFLLLKEKESLTVTEIAQILGFSHPAMIKITRKMQDRGYLDMVKHPLDGRKTLIQLSADGKEALPRYEKEWYRIKEVLQEFVDDDFLGKLNDLEDKLHKKSFHERYQSKFASDQENQPFTIRNADPSEFKEIGQLMVLVYSGLQGFPKADEQPEYYQSLANIGDFTKNKGTELLAAVTPNGKILGGVLYFRDLKHYGSGGVITEQKNASGFRLLAVDPSTRGLGIGKALSVACIAKAREHGHSQILIHSTEFMAPAQKMYKKLGFRRYPKLDFELNGLKVYGFQLKLE
ncbi:bifunctional helix-turn-helix transcriptional regulator/GNAT family N-acetyltransferase [Flagellimonas myxillae]|uniref:bifunctional helix-turn-helix transcriptional regulator/GNAT family N-acetyltransferase n=1 Tax=Flagellimonas myxillae TaxID=2942214 RepID=UPI00201F8719|nr:bifunctional helix-turn-helix transcriptional regulator/GNAT family N-acetyltransferase [Muricauda myxillae]MCL6265516.1 bifunctional helix-turn-helix transcriptional regulator/GNAT family N-acetyltransferase [Muricauda myxillae]